MFSTIVAMTKKMKPTVPILPEEPESISTHEEEKELLTKSESRSTTDKLT